MSRHTAKSIEFADQHKVCGKIVRALNSLQRRDSLARFQCDIETRQRAMGQLREAILDSWHCGSAAVRDTLDPTANVIVVACRWLIDMDEAKPAVEVFGE
nr:hypothetical protein [Stieleria maiorica]